MLDQPVRPTPTRFAYLGPEGTFTEAALHSLGTPSGGERVPAPSVPAALAMVRAGEVDAALVPLENSVEGSVSPTVDGLALGEPLLITREVFLEVDFVLGVRPGTAVADVARVASHPHALAQTRGWVAEHLPTAEVLAAASTADAARLVAEGAAGAPDAAVCPELAARYGLDVVARQLADTPGAVTRFVLVERPGRLPAPTGADRTTVTCSVRDRTGALLDLLTVLASRGLNLTRLDSRPTRERLRGPPGRRPGRRCPGGAASALRRRALPGLLPAGRRPGGRAGPRAAGRPGLRCRAGLGRPAARRATRVSPQR